MKPILEQEYVFQSKETGEFHRGRLILEVTSGKELLTLIPTRPMTLEEIDEVISGFEDDILRKMKVTPREDFEIRLHQSNKLYKVKFKIHRIVEGIEEQI
jgi:hypothetical protein